MVSLSRRFCFGVVTCVAAAAILAPAAIASPLTGHPYRHGFVPLRPGRNHHGANRAQQAPSNANDLAYGGGISDGTNIVGVTTGAEKVYLVFWGSQWGAQSTNGNGDQTYSGDTYGMAADLQAFFKGLGTGTGNTQDLWSGVMTQYCQGVASGSLTCPSTASHVAYPYGGALVGVWEDNSAPAPSAASAHQLGQEAVAAAEHFGNTSEASNRNAQYVIVSPTGTDPDSYIEGGFCAWHDYTGDSTMDGGGAVSTPWGSPVAFTNLPYVTDAGAGCGENFVNSGSAGTLDGVTIVEGHEYAETITDQFPAGGWTVQNIFSFYYGYETGDLCAWISPGQQGGAENLVLTTGTFPVQSTWSNSNGNCETSDPIVGAPSNDFSISASPANVSTTAGSSTSTSINTAVTSGSAESVSLSASGLPSGATASFSSNPVTSGGSSTMTINTSPTTPNGTYTVTVTGTATSGSHATSVTLTVSGSSLNDFSLSASPSSLSVKRGNSTRSTISTALVSGSTTQTVSLSESGQPAGTTVTLSPNSVAVGGSSTLTVATSGSTPLGTYTITITGKNGTTSHTVNVTLKVTKH